MNILVVTQYFWPENFRINDLCEGLSERGHKVTVLTGHPNYPEGKVYTEYKRDPSSYKSIGDINIVRVPLISRGKNSFSLVLNYISYAISAIFLGSLKLKKIDFDIVFCCQLSPITVALPAIVFKKKRKIPLVMWSLDLWPESLIAVNKVKGSFALNVLGRLVSYIYQRCDVILGQTESYLKSVDKYNKGSAFLKLFPNWAERLFDNVEVSDRNNDCFRIIFAGNLGEAQDLASLVECAKILKSKKCNVVFDIVGDGSKRAWFEGEVIKNDLCAFFNFYGRQPLSLMPEYYSKVDMALVTLNKDYISSRTIPGKIQSYMMAGLPVLAMLDGEGAKLIEVSNCGFSCDSGDFTSLAMCIVSLSEFDKNTLEKIGGNGTLYANNNFSRERIFDSLEDIFKNAIEGRLH
ncbi:glycosyltransferase family 4 protein [Marinobacter sp. V034]|uniref:glycosyltransferase family 4 protein n=1 Tax=Marinobacter sp. V034 TaxID=3459610 RepID=UPI004044FD6E